MAGNKESAILDCLTRCFSDDGLPPISPSTSIGWDGIPDPVIANIGRCVRDCINSKGFKSPDLTGRFLSLKDQGRVTRVSELVTAIAAVVMEEEE